jgi:hypothetical protein
VTTGGGGRCATEATDASGAEEDALATELGVVRQPIATAAGFGAVPQATTTPSATSNGRPTRTME